MTITDLTPAQRRCDVAQDFADAGAWIACDLAAQNLLGSYVIQVPVPRGLDREGKAEWLRQVAGSWKADVVPDGNGGMRAVRTFGSLRFVAHVGPEGSRHLAARQDALGSREACDWATFSAYQVALDEVDQQLAEEGEAMKRLAAELGTEAAA